MRVKTRDGTEFLSSDCRLVGSVKKVRDTIWNKPAKIGEFPVFVEQSGSYRMFTFSSKITEIHTDKPDLGD